MPMPRMCGYCLKSYSSQNKTYCSKACAAAAYELQQTDHTRWRTLRQQAREMAEEIAEAEADARIDASCRREAQRLQDLLSPIFTAHSGALGLPLDPVQTTWIERTADGQYQSAIYIGEGEYSRHSSPDLAEVCSHIAYSAFCPCITIPDDPAALQAWLADHLEQ